MYTDGETFYYRSDRPNRVPERPRPGATLSETRPERRQDAGLTDRLTRLESRAEELQATLAQLAQAVERLAQRPEPQPAEPPREAERAAVREPRRSQAREAERGAEREPERVPERGAGREPERLPERVPGLPEAAAEVAAPTPKRPQHDPADDNIKVSVFAGGSATAIVGEIKVQQEES